MTPEELQRLLDSLDRVRAEAASLQGFDESAADQIQEAQEKLKNAHAQAMKEAERSLEQAGQPPAAPPREAPPTPPAPQLPPLDGADLWNKIRAELHLLPTSTRSRKSTAGLDRDIWQDLDDLDKP